MPCETQTGRHNVRRLCSRRQSLRCLLQSNATVRRGFERVRLCAAARTVSLSSSSRRTLQNFKSKAVGRPPREPAERRARCVMTTQSHCVPCIHPPFFPPSRNFSLACPLQVVELSHRHRRRPHLHAACESECVVWLPILFVAGSFSEYSSLLTHHHYYQYYDIIIYSLFILWQIYYPSIINSNYSYTISKFYIKKTKSITR